MRKSMGYNLFGYLPLLSFTSEEAFLELRRVSDPSLPESVFLEEWAALEIVPLDKNLNDKWLKILEIRGLVNDVLDRERKAGVLKSSQEAAVSINPEKLKADHRKLLESGKEDWPFLLQMAEVRINGTTKDTEGISIQMTQHAKCERCWRRRPEVGKIKDHPSLCERCANVVGRQ